MRLSAVFGDSFLDGFTMAGFLQRLPRPGQATGVLASSGEPRLIFQANEGGVNMAGSLRAFPEKALQGMMDLLKTEEELRKSASAKGAHGASR